MVNNISATTVYKETESLAPRATQTLQDQFLTVLVTQLQYQDPMEPMKERDFLAQMAEFNSASSISNLNQTVREAITYFADSQVRLEEALLTLNSEIRGVLEHLKGSSISSLSSLTGLIGREIVAETEQGLSRATVSSVLCEDGKHLLRCQDRLIPLSEVTYVGGLNNAN
jgi:flagellar basal-body rod modification protein FlgD